VFKKLTRDEEKDLADRFVLGDSKAQRMFFDQFKNLIYSTINKFSFVEKNEIDDYFNEFFIRLVVDDYKRIRQWDQRSRLSTYLVTLLRNYLIDEYRKKKKNQAVTDDDEQLPSSEDNIYIQELLEYVRKAMDSLSERDREIINRKLLEDETPKEIADALGITKDAYYVALNRANKRLIKLLKKDYPQLFHGNGDDL